MAAENCPEMEIKKVIFFITGTKNKQKARNRFLPKRGMISTVKNLKTLMKEIEIVEKSDKRLHVHVLGESIFLKCSNS